MKKVLIFCYLYLSALTVSGQQHGLIKHSGTTRGYVLFAPLFSKETFLIDRCGMVVNSWTSQYNPGQLAYLLNDGSLLRTGNDSSAWFFGGGGVIERFDWNGSLTWRYKISDSLQRQHHDICPMANGHILVLVWEKIDRLTAISAGRDTSKLGKSIWSEKIIEIKPLSHDSAELVWAWRAWDHLVQQHDPAKNDYGNVADHPELLDLNYEAYTAEDWLHFNSIDYNAQLDQVLVSNRNFNEVFIIDHSATTKEAATHTGGKRGRGGDLLFRWGNPQAYGRGTGQLQQLYRQHHAHWLTEGGEDQGEIMIFNNGLGRAEGEFSSVEVIEPVISGGDAYRQADHLFLPLKPSWQYVGTPRESFFSTNVSSAERLSNGHTLICEGAQGKLFEVDETKQIQWIYINPVSKKTGENSFTNTVFRASYVSAGHPALKGKKLKKGKFLSPSDSAHRCKTLKKIK